MPINTGTHPKALWPGINAWFGRSYNEHPEQWPDLFDRETSDKNYEEDVEATGFGLAPVKTQGGSISYDTETQGPVSRYTHVAYALGYIVTYEELRDNLYETVSRARARGLAFSMRQTKETIGANVYNNGFDSNYTGADGKELFATNHVSLSGDQSNELATSADMSEASLEDLTIQIMKATDNRGLKIAIRPQSLIVHPDNVYEAHRILKSELQSGTANNDVNAMRSMGVFPKGIKVNQYLSDSDAFFVRTNIPNGMKMFQREAISFDKDNDFDTKNAKAAAYERYSFGWTDWRAVYGSPGA